MKQRQRQASIDAGRLIQLVDAFEGRRIAVFGDLIVDEFIYGEVSRVSREAPVLILDYDSTEIVPGGAGNAAANVAALGRPVVAIFGPTDERVTRPLGDHEVLTESVFCRPCMLRDCPIDHRCMKGISAAAVVEAVLHRLDAHV